MVIKLYYKNIKHDENQNNRSCRNDNRTKLIVGIVEIKNDKNGNKMCDYHGLYLSLSKNVSHKILILDTDMYMCFKPFTSYVS